MFHDTARRSVSSVAAVGLALFLAPVAFAQSGLIRGKKPDRGSYTSPVIKDGEIRAVTVTKPQWDDGADSETDRGLEPAPLMPATSSSTVRTAAPLPPPVTDEVDDAPLPPIQLANHQEVVLPQPPSTEVMACSCESCTSGSYDVVGLSSCDSFGDNSCDAMGCDSIGCGRLPICSDRWFGSVELLLMYREGDRLPPLVTSGPDGDSDTAGELGQAGTQILVGNERILDDMTAGGRINIGMWLDRYKDRSLVARAWFVGEETFGFFANQDSQPVLTRPFFNVTDGQTPEQDTQIIAFPNLADGELRLTAESDLYGGDISIRQLWCKHYGATIDLLYGYQYLGLDENLAIRTRSTSLDDNFAPVGSTISVSDSINVHNDFHGGQIGFATHYREGCWSFSSLVKVGFGSLRRKAVLSGSTLTSIDGNNAVDPQGLLVRSTNTGTFEDDTFSWAPELDFTIGWQRYPNFDVTFGYHIVAFTEALQVSGVVDPGLELNLANTGVALPGPNFRYSTYHAHGIHFGLSYIY
ncbi:MAG: BBP7 family outer membrane beta-barrel protein [Planctomycetota bacterium]